MIISKARLKISPIVISVKLRLPYLQAYRKFPSKAGIIYQSASHIDTFPALQNQLEYYISILLQLGLVTFNNPI